MRRMYAWPGGPELPPDHPRFKFSLDRGIKGITSPADRVALCEELFWLHEYALGRTYEDPFVAELPKYPNPFLMSECPNKPGKVHVRFGE